jgi:hypothetical protein
MSSRIRFNDANDVFDAFPTLARFAPRPNGAAEPLAYARKLNGASPPSAATAYVSHLLPRREAVWWGCQCVSAILGGAAQDEGLRLASRWVREPDDAFRREALAYAETHDLNAATTWLARAVGHSGGSLTAPDQTPAPPAPAAADACAQAVNAAVIIAATRTPSPMILPWIRACVEAGVRFAAGEEARVIAPPVSRSGSPAGAAPGA